VLPLDLDELVGDEQVLVGDGEPVPEVLEADVARVDTSVEGLARADRREVLGHEVLEEEGDDGQ